MRRAIIISRKFSDENNDERDSQKYWKWWKDIDELSMKKYIYKWYSEWIWQMVEEINENISRIENKNSRATRRLRLVRGKRKIEGKIETSAREMTTNDDDDDDVLFHSSHNFH